MAVRLSSGSHRRKQHGELRPTAARTLESVFDMLMQEIEGRRVLDLFAGTGSYGVTALRRGADFAVFVDNSREAEKRTGKALEHYHLEEQAKVYREDVTHFLHRAGQAYDPFDIVFADPPYDVVHPAPVVDAILEAGVLTHGGVLVFEHSRRFAPPVCPGLTLRKSRIIGDTTISIWDRV